MDKIELESFQAQHQLVSQDKIDNVKKDEIKKTEPNNPTGETSVYNDYFLLKALSLF